MEFPELIRNICVAGHLHHGKTSFMDMLIGESHYLSKDEEVLIALDRSVTLISIKWSDREV